jgi:hypothetical protein
LNPTFCGLPLFLCRYAPTAAVALIAERDQLSQRVAELNEETSMLRNQVQIKQEQFDALRQKFQVRESVDKYRIICSTSEKMIVWEFGSCCARVFLSDPGNHISFSSQSARIRSDFMNVQSHV